jgi:hypothetical protein
MNHPVFRDQGAPARTVEAAITALRSPTRRAHVTGRSAWLAEASTRNPSTSSPANPRTDRGALEWGERQVWGTGKIP